MKEFPSCFGESGVQIASSSSLSTNYRAAAQNLVTCVYDYRSREFSGFITVTWIKHIMAQGLIIGIESPTKKSLCKIDIKPSLFSKRKGSRNLVVDSTTIDVHWDLSCAKFGASPEPLEGFHLTVFLNQELCLLLGDSLNGAHKKIDDSSSLAKATFVAKREHIFGKRLYNSKAQFYDKGKLHDIRIEYDPSESFGECLTIYIDRKKVLQVTNLKWKFRGNQSILVDGVSVEVYWDVYSWLFDSVIGNAIFLFRTHINERKSWSNRSLLEPSALQTSKYITDSQGHGFSLVLCAWKNE